MKQFWNKNHEKIITLLLFAILFIGLAAIIALLGGAVMKIFGFKYKSIGSIILFFLIATIISFPISLIAETLPKVLLSSGKLSKESAILLYIILDTIVTFLGLSTVDYFMESGPICISIAFGYPALSQEKDMQNLLLNIVSMMQNKKGSQEYVFLAQKRKSLFYQTKSFCSNADLKS